MRAQAMCENPALQKARLEKVLTIQEVADQFNLTAEEYLAVELNGGKGYWTMCRWCLNYKPKPFKFSDNDYCDIGVRTLVAAMLTDTVKDIKRHIRAYKKTPGVKMKLRYIHDIKRDVEWLLESPYLDYLGLNGEMAVKKLLENEDFDYYDEISKFS